MCKISELARLRTESKKVIRLLVEDPQNEDLHQKHMDLLEARNKLRDDIES